MTYYLRQLRIQIPMTASLLLLLLSTITISTAILPASAAKTGVVEFSQNTYELVAGLSQSLRGVDSVITCADGTAIEGPLFDMSAARDANHGSGSWTMIAAPGAAAGDAGIVEKAQIGAKHYRLTGQWNNFGRANSIVCSDSVLPIDFTLRGHCGLGVTVELTTSTGIRGSFKGDVACN